MVFAAFSEMWRRLWHSARMWKLHDLQTLSTCSSNDSMSSIVTPRLRTLLAGLTQTQPRSTVFIKPSTRCRALVPITIASVLSGFIEKPLRSSQYWTARKHSDSLVVELSSLRKVSRKVCICLSCICIPTSWYPGSVRVRMSVYSVQEGEVVGRLGKSVSNKIWRR